MRKMQIALAAGLSGLLLASGAHALEVKKNLKLDGAASADVWAKVGGFCAIQDWHPAVEKCEESTEGDNTFRTLTLKDGGGVIKEKLTKKKDTSYGYTILESPLPVKDYKANFSVKNTKDGKGVRVRWKAKFEANGKPDDEATNVIAGIFDAGLKSISDMMAKK